MVLEKGASETDGRRLLIGDPLSGTPGDVGGVFTGLGIVCDPVGFVVTILGGSKLGGGASGELGVGKVGMGVLKNVGSSGPKVGVVGWEGAVTGEPLPLGESIVGGNGEAFGEGTDGLEPAAGCSVLPESVGVSATFGGLAGLGLGSNHANVGLDVSRVGGVAKGDLVGGLVAVGSDGVGSIQGAGAGAGVGCGITGGLVGLGASSDGCRCGCSDVGPYVGISIGSSTHLEGAAEGSVTTAGGASIPL